MTPQPPPSPDGSALPPRHRPSIGNLGKDTTEVDLWAFDDLDPGEEVPSKIPLEPPSRVIPKVRKSEKAEVQEPPVEIPEKPAEEKSGVRVNVSKGRGKLPTGSQSGQAKPGSDFDDLDHWDEPVAVEEEPAATFAEIPPPPPTDVIEPTEEPLAPPVALSSKLHLTKLERVCLLLLLATLVLGGIGVFLGTISRLPTESDASQANLFPLTGKHLGVASASSHWRAPKSGETVRRGTQLLPVLEMTPTGNTAAIRVFFRNGEGELVGDAVTRRAQAGESQQIAATAGFDDVGMHAAYRTQNHHPWKIQVFEAPSENSPGSEFTKLFEMEVSPERR